MLNSKKGFSLTTMAITIVVMIVILGSLVYSAVDSVKVRKLNKFYDDLKAINDAVENYYLKYNELPIYSDTSKKITITKGQNRAQVETRGIAFVLKTGATNVELDSFVNPNDYAYTVSEGGDEKTGDATYAYIDLTLLKNLSLNNPNDEYLVNTQSHTVYNVTGVEVDGKTYNYLPIKYINTKHNEKKAVSTIRLKTIAGVSDGVNVYFSPSENKMNLKNLLEFDSETEGDNLGEPKELVFSLASENSYYEVNKSTGEITPKRTTNNTISNNSGEYSSLVTVGVINYGETEVSLSKTFTISTSSIDIYSTLRNEAVEEINLVKKHESDTYKYQKTSTGEKEYQILKNGLLNGQNNITVTSSTGDTDVATATYNNNNNSAEKYMVFSSGEKAGSTDITVEVQNYGLAKDKVTVNVYNFEVCEDSESGLMYEKINLTRLSKKYTENIKLKVEGPNGLKFDGDKNKLDWSIDGDTEVVSLEKDSSDVTKIKLVPDKIGKTNLKCVIILDGEKVEEILIPVVVSGIERTDGKAITDNTIKFSNDEEKTITLKYTFGDNTITSYSFETPTIVPENDFSVTKNNDNTFTVTSIGTSDVTGTLTIVANVGDEKYEDTINITIS